MKYLHLIFPYPIPSSSMYPIIRHKQLFPFEFWSVLISAGDGRFISAFFARLYIKIIQKGV